MKVKITNLNDKSWVSKFGTVSQLHIINAEIIEAENKNGVLIVKVRIAPSYRDR